MPQRPAGRDWNLFLKMHWWHRRVCVSSSRLFDTRGSSRWWLAFGTAFEGVGKFCLELGYCELVWPQQLNPWIQEEINRLVTVKFEALDGLQVFKY